MLKIIKNTLRGNIWRISRKMYRLARKENFYSQDKNGEFWLIDTLTKKAPKNKNLVFFDIGSFKGQWSMYALQQLLKNKLNKANIFAFEPTLHSFQKLEIVFENIKKVYLNRIAFSSQNGKRNFFVHGEFTGNNSFVYNKNAIVETVDVLTVDEFIEKNNLKHIYLIKSDAEGHDFKIIMGAKKAFENELIGFWQLEYNHRWIEDRNFLKDLFVFIKDKNYTIGKLCKNHIEIYDEWHMELEKFFEANYVVLHKKYLKEEFCLKSKFNEHNVLENE